MSTSQAPQSAEPADSNLPEEEEDARDTIQWIERAGRRGLALPGDIQDERHCVSLIDQVIGTLGDISLLVNNAAFQRTHDQIEEVPTEEVEQTFRTNGFAMFWLCRAALPRMQPGSAIINTASIQAFDPSPNPLAYAATKAAIVNFTKALAPTAMKRGVRVNAVAPGPVWTPLIPSTMPEERAKDFGKDTAFGRAAQPVELAPAVRVPGQQRIAVRDGGSLRRHRRADAVPTRAPGRPLRYTSASRADQDQSRLHRADAAAEDGGAAGRWGAVGVSVEGGWVSRHRVQG